MKAQAVDVLHDVPAMFQVIHEHTTSSGALGFSDSLFRGTQSLFVGELANSGFLHSYGDLNGR